MNKTVAETIAELEGTDFDGVFRFTNDSDEDFTVLWNNKEYVFPAKSRSPIVIPEESLENIQAIRKKWAYKWAEREWFKGSEYKKMANMGQGLPPLRNDAVLDPLVQRCLSPLPVKAAKVNPLPQQKVKTAASKALKDTDNLNAAFAEETKEENIVELGKQPE